MSTWVERAGSVRLRDDAEVLTAAEVAKLLRVNKKTVYEAFANGDIPGMRIGSRIRFHRAEVLRLVRQGRVVPNRQG